MITEEAHLKLDEEVKKLTEVFQSTGGDEEFLSSQVFAEANVDSHDCYWKGLAKVLYLHLRNCQKREINMHQDPSKQREAVGSGWLVSNALLHHIQRIEKLLCVVFKDIPVRVGFCDTNLEHRYVRWLNSSAYVPNPEDIIGKRDPELLDVIPGGFELMQIKEHVLSTGIAERRELSISSGEVSWIVVVCEPYFVNGQIEGVITLWIDETAQMAMRNKASKMELGIEKWEKTERELRRAIQYADEALKVKNEYFAAISHEIRTPLTGVLGMAQVLATTLLDAEQKEMVEAMVLSGDVLLSLISDVLDLSKMESGTMKLEEVEFDPREIVKHVAKTAAPSAKVRIVTDIFHGVPKKVVGAPMKTQQVLANLVANAKRFTQEGYIMVKLGIVETEDKRNLEDGLVSLRFAVEDTGIGIPEESTAYIFEKYTQLHTLSRSEYCGTGLGLAICKQLVELMGGKISVSSCVGQGSIFSFDLSCKMSDSGHEEADDIIELPAGYSETLPTALSCPLSEIKRVAEITTPPRAKGLCKARSGPPLFDTSKLTKMRQPKLLLVEDNKVNMMVVVSMLRRFGLTPDVALNGQEAIKAIRGDRYDLVLMDICLPLLDGFEVTKRVRNFEKTGKWEEEDEGGEQETRASKEQAKTPIVAMTANAMPDCEAQCKGIGMDGFVTKPISFKKMEDVLEEFLPEYASPEKRKTASKMIWDLPKHSIYAR